MANAKEIFNRRVLLLDTVKARESIELQDLLKQFKVSRRTLLEDIKYLRQSGSEIEIKKHTVFCKTVKALYPASTEQDIRKVVILMILSERKGITRQELQKTVCEPIRDNYKEVTDAELKLVREKLSSGDNDINIIRELGERKEPLECFRELDSARKAFVKDLEELRQENVIIIEKGRCSLSITLPQGIYYSDKSLMHIYSALINNGDIPAFSPVLEHIAEKTREVIENKLYGEPKTYKRAHLIRDNRKPLENYKNNLERLASLPYKTNRIFISAINNKGNPYKKKLSVGKIIYLCDTGKMYLVGQENNLRWSCVDLSTIQKMELLNDSTNSVFDCKEVNTICSRMLGASIDPMTHHISLLFQDNSWIRKELNSLCTRRGPETAAHLEPQSDRHLLYTDEIYGIYDMAKIVRRFGAACQVLGDQKLKDMMRKSAVETLERYQKDG